MKRLLILLAGTAATPALAQHSGHAAPPPAPAPANPHAGHVMPPPVAADPHAGHVMPAPAPPPVATDPHAGHTMPAPTPTPPAAADPHAGHAMPSPTPPPAAADPHAGHVMPTPPPPPAAADPHAGHVMPAPAQPAADPHAGHQMAPAGTAGPAPPVAPPPSEALSGPAHAADLVYDPARMARQREALRREHGGALVSRFSIDQLEVTIGEEGEGYAWEDVQFWYGSDLNRLWLKSQGEGSFDGELESAELQALFSRAVTPFFDLQAGVRYDFRPDPERAYAVLGIQGLAPYWFEIDAALFLSTEGDVSARVEAEYDLRITQRLILQPRVELDLALQDVRELGIGSGLSTAEAGVRLRYEFVPEFAPYVGVNYERAFGRTEDFRRLAGEEAGGFNLVLGIRAWF